MSNLNGLKKFLQKHSTLDSEIDVGPKFINFGFFSRPYGLIRDYIKVIYFKEHVYCVTI